MKECQDAASGRLEIQKRWFIHDFDVRHGQPNAGLQPQRHQMLARAAVGCKRSWTARHQYLNLEIDRRQQKGIIYANRTLISEMRGRQEPGETPSR